MSSTGATQVLLWFEKDVPVDSWRSKKERQGIVLNISGGKYTVAQELGDEGIGNYEGVRIVIKPKLMDRIKTHIQTRENSPLFGDLANAVKNILAGRGIR